MLQSRVGDGGARFRFHDAELTVRFPGTGRVAVGWNGALDRPSWGLPPGQPAATGEPLSAAEVPQGWLLGGNGISVLVRHDGGLEYLDGSDRVRRRDTKPVWDPAGGWSVRTAIPAGAGVHGLGGRARWDLRGGSYRCWNTDPGGSWLPGDDPLYVTTPVYLCLDDEGAAHCFIDNPGDGWIRVTDEQVGARFRGGPARWHVSLGSLAEVMGAYTALTGRPAVPPRWAFGHHQARWGYGSTAAIRDIHDRFRANRLPLSAIHLDIDHMDRHRNFTFGPDWEGVEDLIEQMAHDGVRTVVIVDAGIARGDDYDTYRDGLAQDAFCRSHRGEVYQGVVWPGPTVFPDFTERRVRDWWGDQLSFYAARGAAGYWHDMNEPTVFAASGEDAEQSQPPPGEGTLPLSTRHGMDGAPADHRAAHNVYGLLMCRASFDGLRRMRPNQRPFLFSRSGWAGMQRYGGHWSGDVQSDWSALPGSIRQAFAFGASGIGYYGSDIGGFAGTPSPELFQRWFQLMSFMPLFRTHCAFDQPRREPWEWGDEVMARLRRALERRYRLLPYWYSLALDAARTGAPLVRPLAWVDPRLRTVDDEFMVGDDVLVAPIIEPGQRSRPLRLPAGAWYHGESGQRFEGAVDLPVDLDDVPWFIREGAVLPTEEGGRLVLLAAPPAAAAAGSLFLADAGDGWDPPHEERLDVVAERDELHVRRTVLRRGLLGDDGIAARTIDGRPLLVRVEDR